MLKQTGLLLFDKLNFSLPIETRFDQTYRKYNTLGEYKIIPESYDLKTNYSTPVNICNWTTVSEISKFNETSCSVI